MQKLKNRKRLTALALAFMLTFLVGAAFAFAPGTLDIVGNVRVANVDELYVIWSDADIGVPIIPLGGAVGDSIVLHTVEIEDARGRTDQRIVWNIGFYAGDWDGGGLGGVDLAMLSATAMNNSTTDDAVITAVAPVWSDAALAAELGLDYTILTALPGTIVAGGTGLFQIQVTWDGTIPSTADYGDYWDLTLTLEFDYAPAP